MKAILDREEIPAIRTYIGNKAASLLAAAGGTMDAVAGLTRAVPLALVQDWFGFVHSDAALLRKWSYWNQIDAFWNQPFDAIIWPDPAKVVDPATCLFYRAVCEHQLLRKKDGLATLDKLLHKTEGVAEPYLQVATLMQDELSALDDQSLSGVSRKMQDSERRLDLGRSGQRVQKVQDEIIESLDEIIKKKQAQLNQQQAQAQQQQNNSNQSNRPAEDSMLKGATAPGNVDPNTKKRAGTWGGLPPKAATEAESRLNREFPSNYRRAVEEYFKKLANTSAGKGK